MKNPDWICTDCGKRLSEADKEFVFPLTGEPKCDHIHGDPREDHELFACEWDDVGTGEAPWVRPPPCPSCLKSLGVDGHGDEPCVYYDDTGVDGNLRRVSQLSRWAVKVEFTFPIFDADVTYRYEGDAEVDFALRAVSRLRPHLESVLDAMTSVLHHRAHFSILPAPEGSFGEDKSCSSQQLARRVI
jgi:hypothetical protein